MMILLYRFGRNSFSPTLDNEITTKLLLFSIISFLTKKVNILCSDIRELKQTDAAAVNRQISIQIQSDGCQGPTEFTWP